MTSKYNVTLRWKAWIEGTITVVAANTADAIKLAQQHQFEGNVPGHAVEDDLETLVTVARIDPV